MHPFFNEIKKYPTIEKYCRTDLTKLPLPYSGKGKLKAIILGADPTNDGIKTDKCLKQLETVFGIGSEYEKYFFAPQMVNLKAIKLNKDNCYIQNLCRNYFTVQTTENKHWKDIAKIWLPFLADELSALDFDIPVFVTAEKIMKVLCPEVPTATDVYNKCHKLTFFSKDLNRNVFPLYRQPTYYLSKNWPEYKEYLKQLINE